MNINVIPAGYENDFSDEDISLEEEATARYLTNQLKITVVPAITAGAGINDQDFDAELTAEESMWFEQFKGTYHTYKQKPTAQYQIRLMLMDDAQPLQLALKLFANCPDCNNLKKNSLALFIMETVCEIYKPPAMVDALQNNNTNCDDNTRMVAFNFMRTCNIGTLQKAVIKTYELHKIKHLLISKLQQLINQGQCKEVANWCILLNLTNLFGLYDLILPLILQDRVTLAENYLINAKEQQLPTIQYLDSLLDKKKTVYEHCDEIIRKYNYKNVKQDFLSHRPMCKLVTRLAKKFQIDMHYTPNLEYSKSSSYLRYLFHKYQAEGMSVESWRELARDEANKSKTLQLDLIAYIAQYDHNLEEALYWVKLYNIPLEECPILVQVQMQTQPSKYVFDNTQDNKTLLENSNSNVSQTVKSRKYDSRHDDEISEETKDNFQSCKTSDVDAHEKTDYIESSETSDYIDVVDTPQKSNQIKSCETTSYIAAKDTDKKSVYIQAHGTSGFVGILNAVGNASMTTTRQNNVEQYLTLPLPMDKVFWIDNRATFLQMLKDLESYSHIAFDSEWKPGVHGTAYGVAVLQLSTRDRVYLIDCLSRNLDSELWLLLGVKVFNNLEILKIGFSINQDINMLHKSIPPLQLNLQLLSGYLDLRDLWNRVKQKFNIKFPYESDYIRGEGLSALTELCFGKRLNKSNQCSNWSKRPLRYDQIVYAALDAYCLISIYYIIAELLSQLHVNIDSVVEEITLATKTECLNGRKKSKMDSADNGIANKDCRRSGKQDNKNEQTINWQQLQSQQRVWKFLCDFMLHDLSKELRKLGLDCLQMFPVSDLNSYIELAKREQYTVLSRGLHYHVFCRTLTKHQCLQVDEDTLDNQVLKLLLRLNVQINHKDLYSRCLKCNHNEFILATSKQWLYLCNGKLDESELNDDNLAELKYSASFFKKQRQQRSWKLHFMTKNVIKTKKTHCGKPIQLNYMNPKMIKDIECYYICNNCGICTWDGDDKINSNIMSYINYRVSLNVHNNIEN